MQVYPFMRYAFNNYEIGNEFNDGTPYYLLDGGKSIQNGCKLDVIGGLNIKNIGLNSAIEVNILEVQSFGSTHITRNEFDIIEVNEEIEIELDVLMPKEWKFEIMKDSVEKSLVFENKDIKKEKVKRINNFLNQNTIKNKLKKIGDKFNMRASQ